MAIDLLGEILYSVWTIVLNRFSRPHNSPVHFHNVQMLITHTCTCIYHIHVHVAGNFSGKYIWWTRVSCGGGQGGGVPLENFNIIPKDKGIAVAPLNIDIQFCPPSPLSCRTVDSALLVHIRSRVFWPN